NNGKTDTAEKHSDAEHSEHVRVGRELFESVWEGHEPGVGEGGGGKKERIPDRVGEGHPGPQKSGNDEQGEHRFDDEQAHSNREQQARHVTEAHCLSCSGDSRPCTVKVRVTGGKNALAKTETSGHNEAEDARQGEHTDSSDLD